MVLFDIERVYKALDIQGTPQRAEKMKLGSWGFNMANQGFSVVRNGREIRHGQSLGCFTKRADFNYFRGEIVFPACLDELFNVQIIKGRYSLDVRLKDAIANRCQATISNIYKGTRTALSRLATRQHASAAVPAEKRTSGLFGKLKRNPIDAKDHAQKKKDLEQRKAAVIAEVEREADADIAKAKLDVEQAKTAEDAKLLALAKEKAEAIVERAKERKANVRTVQKRCLLPPIRQTASWWRPVCCGGFP